jgi:hypothetical protein
MRWLQGRVPDLVGDELAALQRRKDARGRQDPACTEPMKSWQLMEAMSKAMDPELQRSSPLLPLIFEVSEEELAQQRQSGVMLVPRECRLPDPVPPAMRVWDGY